MGDTIAIPASGLNLSNIVINSALKAVPGRLNVCHFNVSSLLPKIDEIRCIFANTNVHIIAASETWLKSHHSNAAVNIDGFKFIRNDRVRKRGGGVGIFIKNNLKFNLILASENLSSEFLFIEIIFPDSKILFGVVYKAPSIDEVTELTTVVTSLSDKYEDIIIMGDFNKNLLNISVGVCKKFITGSCSVCRFSNAFSSLGLSSVGNYATHFSPNGAPSQIDLILTNNPLKFNTFSQICTGILAHDIIFGSYDYPVIGSDISFKTRNYKSVNVETLLVDAMQTPWHNLFKHHFVTHYPTIIKYSGPLRFLSCMRFE